LKKNEISLTTKDVKQLAALPLVALERSTGNDTVSDSKADSEGRIPEI